MENILQRIWAYYERITTSIAFYPSIYAIFSVLTGFFMTYVERAGISIYLQEHVSILVVNNKDTALNILTTLIAGGFSMLIFTFSMVMLLLSQAATNFSPRVLPSLIRNKKHQFILGTFLSTILFNIIIVTSIEPSEENYQVPGFSVLLGIISAVIALVAFVYFIHSISTSIQISNIMENIFKTTQDTLAAQIEIEKEQADIKDFESDSWESYKTPTSGSIQSINTKKLLETAKELKTKLHITVPKGMYIFEHSILFKADRKLEDDEVSEIWSNFIFDESEIINNNFELGFKQLTEIGVKAMSPGINDPGTALDTLNYLVELAAMRMLKTDKTYLLDDDKNTIVKLEQLSFDSLMHHSYASFRTYCKHDFNLVHRLISTLAELKNAPVQSQSYHETVDKQIGLVYGDALKSLKNDADIEIITQLYNKVTND